MFTLKRISWAELVIVVGLACVAAGTSYARASALDPVLYSYTSENGYETSDMWFDADIPKMVRMMSSRWDGKHEVTSEHPLMSLVIYTPVFVLREGPIGLTVLEAIHLTWAGWAALWTITLFILLRVVGCRSFDATLFTVLGMTSASSVFWFTVPEAFSIGSVTIIMALCLTAWAKQSKSPLVSYGLINILTLSITVTNWMVGIFATILNMKWQRALFVIENSFLAVVLLWYVEKLVFPEANFLFLSSGRVLKFLFSPKPSRVLETICAFFSHSVVMPAIEVFHRSPNMQVMTVQQSFPGSGSALGLLAVIAWVVLLSLGAWACFSVMRKSRLIQLIGLTLAAQLGLHIVFGGETFLYSMHFLPLLIVVAACVTFTRFRVPGLILAVIVAVCAGINNIWQFDKALEFLRLMGQIAGVYQ